MSELKERLEFAVTAAIEAGQHTMRYFRSSGLVVDTKSDQSPVTRADKEAEEMLRTFLAKQCPQDGVVGEEFGTQHGANGYKWFLDPIDGTKSFIRGIPLFGTMMGLECDGEAVAGVIVFPALDEVIFAAHDLGAWWARPTNRDNPKQIFVSDVSRLSDAYVSVTSARSFWRRGKGVAIRRLSEQADVSRGLPDCYGHYLVATGRIEIMIDTVMNAWDNAPLQSIIQEAGGQFTDLQGNATIHGGSAISTNGLLHDQALEFFKD